MKRIAVVVDTEAPERIAEALRAALGLGLRGDAVDLVMTAAAREIAAAVPLAGRSLALLAELDRAPRDPAELGDVLAAAEAVEVWT